MLFQPAPSVKSESFKQWFGDSKVVDEIGEPLPVYHGTKSAFTEFQRQDSDNRHDSGWYGEGFYFTINPETASAYAGANQDEVASGANIKPVYVSLKNPYYWEGAEGRTPSGCVD